MKIGQTTVILFLGKIFSSFIGFLATIYFARLLGAEIWGTYAVAIALVGWLKLGGKMGVGVSVQKRMSEGEEPDEYFWAGVILVSLLGTIFVLFLLLFSNSVNAYIGAEVVQFVIVILVLYILFDIMGAGFKGQRRVHIWGILKPLKETMIPVTQVALVIPALLGLGLVGLLAGKAIGLILVLPLGVFLLGISFSLPNVHHFRSLISFAKYSWLGRVESKTFSEADIVIMGFLVPSALIGVYSIAWTIAIFLTVFGASIRKTLFPEISNASFTGNQDVTSLIEDGIAYQGLIIIPGFVGGTILAEPLLLIYSEEFVQGTAVLWILIFAVLMKGYMQQFSVGLKGINRPEMAFKINTIFILSNILLNILLIYFYGWVGAAVATALSAVVGLILSYGAVRRLTEFTVPAKPIAEQWIAAAIMGIFVYSGLRLERTYSVINQNIITVLVLVSVGAAVYFAVLYLLSNEFRNTVRRNLPVDV